MSLRTTWFSFALGFGAALFGAASTHAAPDVAKLYEAQCASCHGADRLGITGPALLPESLKRLRRKKAVSVIAKGRAATQMPAFGEVLAETEISALIDYIYAPPAVSPRWTRQDIEQSLIAASTKPDPSAQPMFEADPLNLFVVVESGDHHVTILDGDTFEPIHRFKSRYALHGGPKFSRDGRYVYFASRVNRRSIGIGGDLPDLRNILQGGDETVSGG